jgi:hypothetical protein
MYLGMVEREKEETRRCNNYRGTLIVFGIGIFVLGLLAFIADRLELLPAIR